ncbi:hypothetical protein HPB50_023967 [Hyalomma asiaticum]|uniref:Uncharacterized protein n=1 Tax=Hyalomma asiaticum TaxID=266040 RepID=A0ACB7S325_HYAAI|nr:hypothetical protein HPB50_023967 [Hyalomma asiaticum]
MPKITLAHLSPNNSEKVQVNLALYLFGPQDARQELDALLYNGKVEEASKMKKKPEGLPHHEAKEDLSMFTKFCDNGGLLYPSEKLFSFVDSLEITFFNVT